MSAVVDDVHSRGLVRCDGSLSGLALAGDDDYDGDGVGEDICSHSDSDGRKQEGRIYEERGKKEAYRRMSLR